jgi:hypothetical protein
MIHAINLTPTKETQIICHPSEMLPIVSHWCATGTVLMERKGALDVVSLPTFHRRLGFTTSSEFLQM